jgi:hypothetical protein
MFFTNENGPTEYGWFMNKHQVRDFISSQNDYLSKYLKFDLPKKGAPLHPAYHFTGSSRFALHDLAIYWASKIGPVHALISSFNISVDAARQFMVAYSHGKFFSLKFLLNAQKKNNFRRALTVIGDKFPIKLMNIHAKIALLWNDDYHIDILYSGNCSNNQNKERGVIFTDRETFEFDYGYLTSLYKQ